MTTVGGRPFLCLFILVFAWSSTWAAEPTRGASPELSEQAATLIFFTGGVGNVLSEIGPQLIASTIDPRQNLGENRNYTERETVCGEIAERHYKGPLILVGHSFGAHAALLTAHCLNTLPSGPRRVDLLILLDTIAILGVTPRPQLIPSNVGVVYNLYQRFGAFQGVHPMWRIASGDETGIFSLRIRVQGLFTHSDLDNQTLPLTQYLVSQALAGTLSCVNLGIWNDERPLDTSLLENPSFFENLQRNANGCRAP